MPDDAQSEPKIHVDSDWKAEAQREKERLDQQTRDVGKRGPLPEPTFAEIVNLIVMQAVVGLGGLQVPGGERLPPDLSVAKHHIDLLAVLEDKTKGNLSDEEKGLLDNALYELRMRYVDVVGGPPAGPAPQTS